MSTASIWNDLVVIIWLYKKICKNVFIYFIRQNPNKVVGCFLDILSFVFLLNNTYKQVKIYLSNIHEMHKSLKLRFYVLTMDL